MVSECTYIVSFDIEFSDKVWFDLFEEDFPTSFDDVTSFIIETEYTELDYILESIVESHIFSDNGSVDELEHLHNEVSNMSKEHVMKVLAYHEEYTISSIKELIEVDLDNVQVIQGYDSAGEYLRDYTMMTGECDPTLANFVNWDDYADYLGFNWHTLEIDSETFIYQLT